MAYNFNADEIFAVAIKIEENGAAFYRKAASLQKDEENQKFLQQLAKVEDNHKTSFEKMRKELSEMDKSSTVFDPQDELGLYLSAMADAHGGEGDPKVTESLTENQPMKDILNIAIGLEKESILFYLGIKNLLPPKYGQEKIDDIIKEEQRHIAQLNTFLKKLS
ncbi:MAG: ferritin family protein [Desulfamplus sp.]|nr:ferritin family protein [Desulfamplus sp.]